ncbi:MAG: phnA protein [Moraxellaceae bacterium]|nr:MAG: phnA protein [Moraxellaceae bacterium]
MSSKARAKHAQRLDALSMLGKDLTRRSRAHCELCHISGVKLASFEVAPIQDVPDIEHTIFLCETCNDQLNKPKTIQPDHWHCLSVAVWSEVRPAQVVAVRMVKRLSGTIQWAADLYEQVYLEPDVIEWIDQGDI